MGDELSLMNTCIKCDVEMDDYRLHLGYKECTDCSEEEKYSSIRCIHIRQVVMFRRNQDEVNNLKRMDRRSEWW